MKLTGMERTYARIGSGKSLKIITLGDSLTYGWMVDRGYVEQFRDLFHEKYPDVPLSIIKSGVPGSTAEEGLSRLKIDLISKNPNLFFVQFGINDAYTGYSPDEFQGIIEKIVKTIKNNTEAEILILTSVTMNNENEDFYIEQYYGKLEEVARSESTGFVPVHSYWKKRIGGGADFSALVQEDRVHPTEKGYLLMAEAIMEAF